MRDIDHISVSVGPPVTRDYRIDRNRTVVSMNDFSRFVVEPRRHLGLFTSVDRVQSL